MIYIYVYPVEGFDRHIADNELIAAYLNDNGVQRYTQEEFIEAINDDAINSATHWVKMINDRDGLYSIAFLHADDLKESGYDTSKVTESDMLKLADKLNNDYLESMFWESLKIFADHIGIPHLNDEKNETSAELQQEVYQWNDVDNCLPEENVYVICRYDDYYFIGYLEDGTWYNHSAADTILSTDVANVEYWKKF
jgi:hypothetical protein